MLRFLAPVLLGAGAVVCGPPKGQADEPAALCQQGKALKDGGDLKAAAAAYEEALRLDPRCEEAHWGLAWVYRKQGLREAAQREFAQVLQLTTDEQRAKEAREALARMGAKRPREGVPTPPSPPPPRRTTEISLQAARQLLQQHETFEAVRVLRALIAADSDRAAAEGLLQEVERGRRLVRVRAAAGPVFRERPGWEERLRARFAAAAEQIARQAPLDFALVSVEAWSPAGTSADGIDIIKDLQASVPDDGVDVVVGFLAERRDAPAAGDRMEIKGYTLGMAPCFTGYGVVSEVIASRDGQEWRVPEEKLRENLVHELGHLFGAVHVRGNSVMRAQPGGEVTCEFDPLNLEVIKACRWVDFREHFASLSPGELERLAELYGRLSEGEAADDGVHFYRAVTLTFLDRYEEAIEEYQAVLAASWQDPYTHLNLGRLYAKVGNTDQARVHFGIAATLGQPPEVAEQARKELAGMEGGRK